MTMKSKIITICTTIAIIAVVIAVIPKNTGTDNPATTSVPTQSPPQNVTVSISKEKTPIIETEQLTKEQSPEKETEQENVPIPNKPEPPKEAPKAQGSYTNPEAPPTYTEKETVREPSKQAPPKNSNGKAYVDGFGYVEQAGSSVSIPIDSDGDIDKQVGTMGE